MSEELGKIEKPPAEEFKRGRKLYFVPLIYCGRESPADYLEKFNKYWNQVENQMSDLELKLGKVDRIYHELIPVGGEDGLKAIKELNDKSCQIIKNRLDKGAQLEATGRTLLWRFDPLMDIATVAALPPDHLVLFEDLPFLQILEQGEVSFLVLFLNLSHFFEEISNLTEAFLAGYSLKLRVHLGILVVLTFHGCFQIGISVSDSLNKIKLLLGMFPFILGCLQKYPGNLLETFLLSYRGKVGILVARL